MQRAEISAGGTSVPSLPMNAVWRTVRSYILWQHERGTLHYDIMVTLILLFVFFSPYWINYNDKPIAWIQNRSDVVVTPQAQGLFLYQIPAAAVTAQDDRAVHDQLLRVIEPISGEVSIVRYEAVKDRRGRVQSYKVTVQR